MRERLGADIAHKRLTELVGKRVEVVTTEGRWFGWLRSAPRAASEARAANAEAASAGEFTLWGGREDHPDQELPFRAFPLDDVLGIREMQ